VESYIINPSSGAEPPVSALTGSVGAGNDCDLVWKWFSGFWDFWVSGILQRKQETTTELHNEPNIGR